MPNLIHRITHRLSLLFGPGTGTRRAGASRHRAQRPTHLTAPAPRLPLLRSPYCRHFPLDGTASRLVRPYLTAHEQERALRWHRRRVVVLAAGFGADLDLGQYAVGARKAAA
ncbi:hypothetical protein OH738_23680 [Streptomyces hirsutus]|uniref:Uncharacterized protein n=1 Tax=Streptomyces hirsutus TaxID=35620 RepID=A0ABZ1GPQ2_9ACTN|nr:hypothetical protein [Streptomyces hirsutus]WSD07114.1 hypothetical protein OIE73_15980 [Streptomyces hirsutus]WTD19468.1 hypothetical protein OH738_23680 [Streptomyces hirsutus]WTD75625.1 hypothetical protein OHB56_17990 [Streptomyces sp. NBC_01635]